jgi:hypothetical protein
MANWLDCAPGSAMRRTGGAQGLRDAHTGRSLAKNLTEMARRIRRETLHGIAIAGSVSGSAIIVRSSLHLKDFLLLGGSEVFDLLRLRVGKLF